MKSKIGVERENITHEERESMVHYMFDDPETLDRIETERENESRKMEERNG